MSHEVEVVVPSQLEEMISRMFSVMNVPSHFENGVAYDQGWITGASKREYAELVRRDGIPSDPLVIKLLCELAVMRGLVGWYEIKDKPPPMPSIKDL